ncbi:MAG: four-helix bundle copper-binding protein [Verrucomicrobiota bacterium]
MNHGKHRVCIEACQACVTACEQCASACLREEEVKMMRRGIELDRSCAYICEFAAHEMARESPFAEKACRLCAEICEACAMECGKHPHEHCQACAEACRRCAEACRAMASGEAAALGRSERGGETDRPLRR